MAAERSLEIFDLKDKPEYAETLAAWYYAEWACLLPNKSLQTTIRTVREQAQTEDSIYKTWVGIVNGFPVATASFREQEDTVRNDLRPRLGGVYVHPYYRGKGYGEKMVKHVMDYAQGLGGLGTLYLITETAGGLYQKLGWQEIEVHPDRFEREGIETHVMSYDLRT